MGTKPINKLLISTAVPLIISMLVQAFYNVVDSFFVAKISQDAFNAVSLAFPVQNIMIAIGSGAGAGIVAFTPRSLGEKNKENANMYAVNGVFLAVCSYVLMLLFGIFFSEVFFKSQTNIVNIIKDGTAYLKICCGFSFGLFGQFVFERLMQSTGKASLSMWTQSVGAVINIILDPILIFGYLGLPEMGVAGAAVATVIGQLCGLITGIILNAKFNKEITLNLKNFKPDGKIIGDICKVGIPSALTIGIGSVMTYLMNRLLIDLEKTATAAAVFGAFFKLQSFIFMPVVGLAHGMSPIVAFNLGAGKKERMLKAYRLSVAYAVCFTALAVIVTISVPEKLLSIFNATDFMIGIGVPALRIVSIGYPLAGYGIVTSQFFMACGRSTISLAMSIIRQLALLLPAAYILGYTLGYGYVWFAIPIGELGSAAMGAYGRTLLQRKVISRIEEGTY